MQRKHTIDQQRHKRRILLCPGDALRGSNVHRIRKCWADARRCHSAIAVASGAAAFVFLKLATVPQPSYAGAQQQLLPFHGNNGHLDDSTGQQCKANAHQIAGQRVLPTTTSKRLADNLQLSIRTMRVSLSHASTLGNCCPAALLPCCPADMLPPHHAATSCTFTSLVAKTSLVIT